MIVVTDATPHIVKIEITLTFATKARTGMTHTTVNAGTPLINLATLTFGTFVLDRPSRFNPFNRRNRILRFNQGIGQFPTEVITDTIATFGINRTKRINIKFGKLVTTHIQVPLRQFRCNRHFPYPLIKLLVSRFNSSIKRRCKKSNEFSASRVGPRAGWGREPRAASREPRAASREPGGAASRVGREPGGAAS